MSVYNGLILHPSGVSDFLLVKGESEMETYAAILIIAGIIGTLFFLGRWYEQYKQLKNIPKRKSPYIKEVLIKLLENPFNENKWWWTKFNPRTRTWHWVRVASDAEVIAYKDVVLSEKIGNDVLTLGEKHDD